MRVVAGLEVEAEGSTDFSLAWGGKEFSAIRTFKCNNKKSEILFKARE